MEHLDINHPESSLYLTTLTKLAVKRMSADCLANPGKPAQYPCCLHNWKLLDPQFHLCRNEGCEVALLVQVRATGGRLSDARFPEIAMPSTGIAVI
jgi:hypothetical protein